MQRRKLQQRACTNSWRKRFGEHKQAFACAVDSNIAVYALVKDYPTRKIHEKCLRLLERALRGDIKMVLCLNPIMIVETFSALVKLLGILEAEYRVSSLLDSKRLVFLSVSRSSSENAVRWAKESEVPNNDAMMAGVAVEHSAMIYTADEKHFRRLRKYGAAFRNPLR